MVPNRNRIRLTLASIVAFSGLKLGIGWRTEYYINIQQDSRTQSERLVGPVSISENIGTIIVDREITSRPES